MLSWAVTFLVLAIVAALFGFGVIATASVQIAQFLFFVFVALFILSVMMRVFRSPPAI